MKSTGMIVLLSAANWVHLSATVLWIGAMATNLLIIMPSAGSTLTPPLMGQLLGAIMKKFRVAAYCCAGALLLSGVLMSTQNSGYTGFLKLENLWSVLLLIKHIVVICLIILAVYSFEVFAPRVGRAAAKGPSPELGKLQARQMNLAKVGLILGVAILALTAVIETVI
jgi:uncharacterized membrane protein